MGWSATRQVVPDFVAKTRTDAFPEQDELFPTFGQGDPELVDQAHAHWSAFVHDLNPDGGWQRYTGSVDSVRSIGGGSIEMDCPAVWGNEVRYDWQVYS